jgi:hypothetical protein
MKSSWESLQEFMTSAWGRPILGSPALTRDIDLYHDLDMQPDRIEKLMADWARKFNVDATQFDINDYYPSKNLRMSQFLTALIKAPFSAAARDALATQSLTLGMLEEAMQRGRWEAWPHRSS